MKKTIYVLSLFVLTFFGSCEDKETEGISRITEYAVVTLEGDNPLFVEKGTAFSDPGSSSSGGEEVVVSGTVNSNACGFYTLNYLAYNEDGFPGSASRRVVVYEEDDVMAGVYNGVGIGSSGSIGGLILVYPNGDGSYSCTDLLGGYYAQGRGYGDAYAALSTGMTLAGNVITATNGSTAFGPVGLTNGLKDGDKLTWNGTLLNYGLTIGVELNKLTIE